MLLSINILKSLSNPIGSISLNVFFNFSANKLALASSLVYSTPSFFRVGMLLELFLALILLISDQKDLELTGFFLTYLESSRKSFLLVYFLQFHFLFLLLVCTFVFGHLLNHV